MSTITLETWLAFVHRMETIFGSDLTADGSHHGTGRFTSDEWYAYIQVINAARMVVDGFGNAHADFAKDVAELLAGLAVPVSLSMPLGAAREPWGRLYERFGGAWSSPEQIEERIERALSGRTIFWCEQHDDQQYGDKTHYCGVNFDGGASAPCQMVEYVMTRKDTDL